ncbi:hypothetical protein N7491_002442 [Penicillium cf. griseofulvum]|nr:hypothetical protein N7491_002442 [Penicillium cf. griseofulvum]
MHVTAVSPSKVEKTHAPRADRKTFTKNEVFLYLVIKNSGAKVDYEAISKALGKSKVAAVMQMSRLSKGIEEFLKHQEGMIENMNDHTHPEDTTNANQDESNGDEDE